MKAAVFVDVGNLAIRDLPDPTPGPDEVPVRVTACGVCGTDVHIYHGHLRQNIRPPVVLGHEIAGVIEAIGAAAWDLEPGQNVCIDPVIGCGSCDAYHIGRPNLCESSTITGYVRNGGFAQFVVVPASSVWRLAPTCLRSRASRWRS